MQSFNEYKRQIKKIFAMVLAFVMVLGLTPFAAYSNYNDDTEETTDIQNNDEEETQNNDEPEDNDEITDDEPQEEEEEEEELIQGLYTEFTPAEHITVTFWYNYQSQQYSTQLVTMGELLEYKPQPDRIFWPVGAISFRGWFTMPQEGFYSTAYEAFNFTQPIEKPLALFAHYDNRHLVKVLNAEGTVVHSARVGQGFIEPDDIDIIHALGHSITPPSGQVFAFWAEEGSDIAFDIKSEINRDIVLVPIFAALHVITFISDGDHVSPITAVHNSHFTLPPNPSRVGFEFRHWALTPDGDTPFIDEPITSDLTLYAVWNPQMVYFTVVYWVERPNFIGDPGEVHENYIFHQSERRQAQAGSMVNLTNGSNFEAFNLPQGLTLTNGTEWATFRHGESRTVLGNGNTVINVYLRRVLFTFEFDLNPGTNNNTNRRGATMAFDGHSFSQGISPEGVGFNNARYSFQAKYEQDITHLWPSSANATFLRTHVSRNNASSPWGNTATANFTSWARASNISAPFNFVTHRLTVTHDMVPNNGQAAVFTVNWGAVVVRYAQFWIEALPNETGIPMEFNGVTRDFVMCQRNSQVLNIQSNTTLNPREIEGARHIGDNNLRPDGTVVNSRNSNDVQTYRFFYTRNRHNLHFNTMGGQQIDAVNIMFGQEVLEFVPDEIDDKLENGFIHRFMGWYLDADYRVVFDPSMTMPNSAVTLFARWASTELEVTLLYALGGLEMQASPIPIGRGQHLREEFLPYQVGQTVEGWGVFVGWSRLHANNILRRFSFDTPIMEHLTLVATWQTDGFVITYDIGQGIGETPVNPNDYKLNTTARIAGNNNFSAPPGYTFIGWTEARTPSRIFFPDMFVTIDGHKHFTALFVSNDRLEDYITVAFHPNFVTAQLPWSRLMERGTVIYLDETRGIFHRSGYVQVGWHSQAGDNNNLAGMISFEGTIQPQDSIVYYAVWERIDEMWFTVIYEAGEQGTFDTQVFENLLYGANTPAFDGIPEGVSGWIFAGWYPDVSETVTENAIYVAQWIFDEENDNGDNEDNDDNDNDDNDDSGDDDTDNNEDEDEDDYDNGNNVSNNDNEDNDYTEYNGSNEGSPPSTVIRVPANIVETNVGDREYIIINDIEVPLSAFEDNEYVFIDDRGTPLTGFIFDEEDENIVFVEGEVTIVDEHVVIIEAQPVPLGTLPRTGLSNIRLILQLGFFISVLAALATLHYIFKIKREL